MVERSGRIAVNTSSDQDTLNPELGYGDVFYAHSANMARDAARVVIPLLAGLTPTSSVVDVGSGVGIWLNAFVEAGVTDVCGLDSPEIPRSMLKIPAESFIGCDLTQPPALGRTFDLAMSLEVAEHLPPSAASDFIRYLTSLAPVVVFSAAIPGQGGTQHINEQWPSYWAELFRSNGFEPHDVLRPVLWNLEGVEAFYRQNIIVYAKTGHVLNTGSLPEPEIPLDLVHPKTFAYQHDSLVARFSTPMSVRGHLRTFPGALRDAVKRRLR